MGGWGGATAIGSTEAGKMHIQAQNISNPKNYPMLFCPYTISNAPVFDRMLV